MTSIWDRSATAASNTSTPPAGFPADQAPSLVAPQFRAEMAYETEFVHSILAGGTADALTVTYTNAPASLTDGMEIHVRAAAANTTTTPTLNVNSLGAKTITKLGGTALLAGDIAGDLHELTLRYNLANTRWELLNPSGMTGPASSTDGDIPKFSGTSGKVLADGYTVGTAANNLVQLDSSAKLPAIDGSQLTGLPAAATQADQETGTSTTTFVAPGRQQFHPSAAKGWCVAQTNGVAAVSYNVSSITDSGTGHVVVNWSTDFSSSNYSVIATIRAAHTGSLVATVEDSTMAVGSSEIYSLTSTTGAATDPNLYNIAAYGDQ